MSDMFSLGRILISWPCVHTDTEMISTQSNITKYATVWLAWGAIHTALFMFDISKVPNM